MLAERDRIQKPQLTLGRFVHWSLLVALGLGLVFRFAWLDYKTYWYDEAFTSLRVAGYTEAEVVQHFAQPTVRPTAELQQYQRVNPDRGWADTLNSLALEDPQHPPLYYSLATLWSRGLGTSVTAMRVLPALLSLLALPAAYWLCQELFIASGVLPTASVGWIAMALLAVSPLQVLYAQEARQYSLWSATSLLTTATLLRAVRLNTIASWGLYALTLAANLYTFLLAGLMVVAHTLYMLLRYRLTPRFWAYLGAVAAGSLLFLPWAWRVAQNFAQADAVTRWTRTVIPLPQLIKSWVALVGRNFFELDQVWIDRTAFGLIALLVGYGLYRLWRRTPGHTWGLVFAVIGVPALPLMLADALAGGVRSVTVRYMMPVLVGLTVAMAYLLAERLAHTAGRTARFWQGMTLTLLLGGILSCAVSAQAITWWHRDRNQGNLEIAQILNQAPNPLLISDAETGYLLSLSHLLRPDLPLLIQPRCYACQLNSPMDKLALPPIPSGYSTLFLYHPKPEPHWLQEIANQQTYLLEPVVSENTQVALWRVTTF